VWLSTTQLGRLPTLSVHTESCHGKRLKESAPMLSGSGFQKTNAILTRERTSTAGKLLIQVISFVVIVIATKQLYSTSTMLRSSPYTTTNKK